MNSLLDTKEGREAVMCACKWHGEPNDFIRRNTLDTDAFIATCNPANIAEMLVMESKRLSVGEGDRTRPDCEWFSFSHCKEGIEVHKYGWIYPRSTIRHRGIMPQAWRASLPRCYYLTMPQARDVLFMWIYLPDGAMDKAIEAMQAYRGNV